VDDSCTVGDNGSDKHANFLPRERQPASDPTLLGATTRSLSVLKYFRADAAAVGLKMAMRRLASTVAIVSTRHLGQRYGMAVTAIHSFSADPPSLLVSVNKSASIYQPLRLCRRFAVSLLCVDHAALVPVFGGVLRGEERFRHGSWTDLQGLPVLDDAQAAVCCEIRASVSFGSHEAFVGTVLAVRVKETLEPLLYEDGAFARSVRLQTPCMPQNAAPETVRGAKLNPMMGAASSGDYSS
jgi:flavin reductase